MPLNLVYANNGLVKSIPFNALPPDAWQSLTGGALNTSSMMERFATVPVFYRAGTIRGSAMGNMPYCFVKEELNHRDTEDAEKALKAKAEQELEDYDLPFDLDLSMFLNLLYGDLGFFGAAYFFKLGNATGAKKDVRRVHPSTITPKYDDDAGLVGFDRKLKGDSEFYNLDEMGYVWLPNRKAELGPGESPAMAAMRAIEPLYNADEFIAKYFENATIAPTLIEVPLETPDDDVKRIESWAKGAMSGIKNAFRTVGIRGGGVGSSNAKGGIGVNKLGQDDLTKLDTRVITDSKREDVCIAWGIPLSILFSNAANYATSLQDDVHFYDKTIVPDSKLIESELNKQLFEPLGIKLRFKTERLKCYQQQALVNAASSVPLVINDVLQKNEAREIAGYEPIKADAMTDDSPNTDMPAKGEASTAPNEQAKSILGYHIEQGVVTRNEARAAINLPPVDDAKGQDLRELTVLLNVLQAAVTAGIPLENAITLVGLESKLPPDTLKKPPPPPRPFGAPLPPTNEDEPDAEPAAPMNEEMRQYRQKAINRLKAGKSLAFEFEAEHIPATLKAAVSGALESVTNMDALKSVFANAMTWGSYP